MDWSPDGQILRGLIEILKNSFSNDGNVQRIITKEINDFKHRNDSLNYLCCILLNSTDEPLEIRQVAGLLLKNWIGESITNSTNDNYLRLNIINAISDKDETIRNTTGNIISMYLMKNGLDSWPEVLDQLVYFVQVASSSDIAITTLGTIKKIVEDKLEQISRMINRDPEKWKHDPFNLYSVNKILPMLFITCDNEMASPTLQSLAIEILAVYNDYYYFAFDECATNLFPTFWDIVGRYALRNEQSIKISITGMICKTLDYNYNAILSNVDAIFDYILKTSSDESYNVRLNALKFWPEVLHESKTVEHLADYLPRLVPVLVQQTVYSFADFEQMDEVQLEENNSNLPDESSQLKPRFYHGKNQNNRDSDDEISEKGIYKTAWGTTVTARKAAALALDVMTTTYKGKILSLILPLIDEKLCHASWLERESGVLVLGAISKGCMEELNPFAANIIHKLVELSQDNKPLLRNISCWSISRFSEWICTQKTPEIFNLVVMTFLNRILDKTKCVQDAACSAFSFFIEAAGRLLTPFLPQIFVCFATGLKVFQARNIVVLYDTIGTLAQNLEESFATAHPPEVLKILLDPLFENWNNLKPQGYQTPSLCECMGCILLGVGKNISCIIPSMLSKCDEIITYHLNELRASIKDDLNNNKQIADNTEYYDPGNNYNTDLIECCLDLVGWASRIVDQNLYQYFADSKILDILQICICEEIFSNSKTLIQSALALLGDLSHYNLNIVRTKLPAILLALTKYIKNHYWSVESNAIWALDQILENIEAEEIEIYKVFFVEQLIEVLKNEYNNFQLKQNACITLTKFIRLDPSYLAEKLPQYIHPWIQVMRNCSGEEEEDRALINLVIALKLNKQVLQANLPDLKRLCNNYMTVTRKKTGNLKLLKQVNEVIQWIMEA